MGVCGNSNPYLGGDVENKPSSVNMDRVSPLKTKLLSCVMMIWAEDTYTKVAVSQAHDSQHGRHATPSHHPYLHLPFSMYTLNIKDFMA